MKQSTHRIRIVLLCTVLAITACLLGACSSNGSNSATSNSSAGASSASSAVETVTITDMVGRTVEIPANPEKIIGIGSSSLRIISYMQAVDKVVGVELSEHEDSVTCTYRHVNIETFSKLPVIGEGGSKGVTPNEEAIIEAGPEVIIASIDKDSADALQQKTGIPVVCITLSDIVFDQVFYDNIEMVGNVLGKQERAAEIIKFMQDTETDLAQRTSGVEPKTAYAAGISYRGGHGFAGTEAGFAPFTTVNVTNIDDINGASGCFNIDLEAVSSAQPEYVFIESGNLDLVKEDIAANPDYFKNLTAVNSGNVYSLVSYRFYATNVDLALANCYQVGCAVYPEQFSDVDPTQKLDEITTFFLGAALSEDLAAQGCIFGKYDLMNL